MPSTKHAQRTPVPTQSELIRRVAGTADTIGGLLAVFGLFPAEDQHETLVVASRLADDLARDLAALVGGEA